MGIRTATEIAKRKRQTILPDSVIEYSWQNEEWRKNKGLERNVTRRK
jgi:hypothetical protein